MVRIATINDAEQLNNLNIESVGLEVLNDQQ